MVKLFDRKEKTSKESISDAEKSNRELFIGWSIIMGVLVVILGLLMTLKSQEPPKVWYTGDVIVTEKFVKGYACIVRYVQEDGVEDGVWLGKPGHAVCDRVNLGPAQMDDGRFVKGTLSD